MAKLKILAVEGRAVTVDVTWDDDLFAHGVIVNDVPVESFEEARQYLTAYISGLYASARAEEDAAIRARLTPDPMIIAAIGHTFDNEGNILS